MLDLGTGAKGNNARIPRVNASALPPQDPDETWPLKLEDMTDEETLLLIEALDFSARKHRDQRRKDAVETPYINHPIALMRLLSVEAGHTDPDVLAAAALHDTIEDTCTTAAELRARFGARVTSIVLELTDDKSLPKDERKRLQIENAGNLSAAGAIVSIGDKICNLRDMVAAPPPEWTLDRRREYFDWARAVVEKLPRGDPGLERLFDEVYKERP